MVKQNYYVCSMSATQRIPNIPGKTTYQHSIGFVRAETEEEARNRLWKFVFECYPLADFYDQDITDPALVKDLENKTWGK